MFRCFHVIDEGRVTRAQATKRKEKVDCQNKSDTETGAHCTISIIVVVINGYMNFRRR